jgi:hypothetical protein
LYAVEGPAGQEGEQPGPDGGRVLGLDPRTLAVESEFPIAGAPGRLAVAPDGEHAYLLLGHALRELDLATGQAGPLLGLPDRGLDLAVTPERVYVTNPYGHELWAVDRRRWRLVQTLAVGRHPVALALDPQAWPSDPAPVLAPSYLERVREWAQGLLHLEHYPTAR